MAGNQLIHQIETFACEVVHDFRRLSTTNQQSASLHTMDAMPDPILDPLNPEQRAAVTHGDGPLLILAGAGSGKTRVLTHRIAYLIRDLGIQPRQILAVTFTNKAAREMKERLERLLGEGQLKDLTVGTFPPLFARPLRRRRGTPRSEEHTSELQSHFNIVCRPLLSKKKQTP